MAKHVLRTTTIEEIARFLTNRRKRRQSPVLFLGHRAGGLFNNPKLYVPLQGYSLRQFDLLSDIEKFEVCFKALSMYSKGDKEFKEKFIPQLLSRALNPLKSRDEDRLMANFINAGFFSSVITTNIDALLEKACASHGMEQPYNYRVLINNGEMSNAITLGKTEHHQIIKVFGDLRLSYNRVGKEFNLEADQILKAALCSKLSEEVLMLGYDPNWDQAIEHAFLDQGKVLWYVNEDLPIHNTSLMHALNQRSGKYLVGPQGSYRGFLMALNSSIENSLYYEFNPVSYRAFRPPSTQRTKAFISYSHENSEYLKRLQTHVKSYWYINGDDSILDCWDDTQIPKGANWKVQIERELESAKVAVLLVSADFLASEFIRKRELPVVLEAAEKGEITILSVVLGPCPFDRTPLSSFQTINRDSKPLASLPLHQQEEIWAEAAAAIFDILNTKV